ncbi:hypothetical protein O6H91_06G095800 [Diphasiastrum complanatum]|uniref:Uncharacterized protein n=2 Tax=Diphasiastrum complanatum TaxID=34168 RepID=A0ACC2DGR5_DIPCM|nr:hypothetical protein O6H91_06G095800 [Diphasiastrum complanatum]KAJ7553372.1 hypothetical protein O6H91_06G095800 [Diphasiastrum complanatum]
MQEQLINPSNQMLSCGRQLQDRRSNKPNPSEEVLKCPRCESSNTKFCYYNNYSLAQPRHFCKNCKRYWTRGGALRNVPVGGGCRKNKRAKQRSADQATSPAPAEEALFPNIRSEGPSSSTSLQQEFSVGSSSQGLFVQGSDGEGVGLTFERLDQGARTFPGGSVPVSINWAGHASSDATLSLQPFESSILGLNVAGHHVKQEAGSLQSADLSSIFDPQLNLIGQTPPALGDSLGTYNLCMDSFGMAASSGDIQWRLPHPRLVSMMEGGHGYNGRSATQTMEEMRAESIRNFRKSALEEMPVPNVQVDNQGADRLPSEWQSHPEGFFDGTGDGAYWSNGGWPQDDMYEDHQLA